MVLRERVERGEQKLNKLKRELGSDFRLKKIVGTLYAKSHKNQVTAVFRKRSKHAPVDLTIGKLGDNFSLEQAILQCMQYEEDIAQRGSIDNELREIQLQKASIVSLDDLAHDLFFNDDVDEELIGSSQYLNLDRYMGLYLNHISPVLGNTPVKIIDGTHLDLLHRSIGKKRNEQFKYNATKVHANTLMRKLLDRGVRYKLTDFNAARYFTARELGYKDESDRNALLIAELQILVERLESLPSKDRINVICIYLLLLFGVRVLDLVRAKVDDFRNELIPSSNGITFTKEPIWLLNTGKVNVFRSMYITPFANSLLSELAELQLKAGSEYLLPARKSNSQKPHVHKTTLNKFLSRITDGLDLMIHEIRYTTRSTLSVLQVDDDVAESYISHSPKRYLKNFHHLFHSRKKGAEALSNLIEHFIKPERLED